MKARRAMKKGSPAGATLVLRLYVAGRLPGSVSAEAMVRELCAGEENPPRLEVVDLLVEPERALADGIMVTPTLVRLSPKPEVRILGFLADLARVRAALGLTARAKGEA